MRETRSAPSRTIRARAVNNSAAFCCRGPGDLPIRSGNQAIDEPTIRFSETETDTLTDGSADLRLCSEGDLGVETESMGR